MKSQRLLFTSILLLSLLFSFSSLLATKEVNFSMDYGRFRYDTSSVYLEVYYVVYPCDIEFQPSDAGYEASCELDFSLLNMENDSILAQDKIPVKFNKDELSTANEDISTGQMGVVKLVIPRGKYFLRMSSPSDTVKEEISVSPFSGGKIAMSDLQICSNIITRFEDQEHPFYKNTMKVIPNPSGIFGVERPLLYYYLEIYNIKTQNIPGQADLKIQAVIADGDGNIRLKKDYVRPHSNESLVERGMFNVSKLETGLYTFIFAAVDSVENVSVYRRRNFYVHNPNIVVVKPEDELERKFMEQFAVLNEKEVDKMFEQAAYLASDSEKKVYKVLNSLESKKQFLARFWSEREKGNEGWKDLYYQRVDESNQKFSQGGVEGWFTDMGRIYVIYGPPDEYERNPVNPNENPYEIWHYLELEGGVEFDFVDINGFGIFQLVNSTKRGEVSFYQWREQYVLAR